MTSISAVIFTWLGLKIQRTHNFKSVRPIGKIRIGDYESNIFIRIDNYGTGPLIIKHIVVNGEKLKKHEGLFNKLPDEFVESIRWRNFTTNYVNRVIPSNGTLELIRWTQETDFERNETEVSEIRAELRRQLKDLKIKVVYTDIYEKNEFSDKLKLTWFSRNL